MELKRQEFRALPTEKQDLFCLSAAELGNASGLAYGVLKFWFR